MTVYEVTLEQRVGLTKRELRWWVKRLRDDRKSAKAVADEMERAVFAALDAGLVLPEQTIRVTR